MIAINIAAAPSQTRRSHRALFRRFGCVTPSRQPAAQLPAVLRSSLACEPAERSGSDARPLSCQAQLKGPPERHAATKRRNRAPAEWKILAMDVVARAFQADCRPTELCWHDEVFARVVTNEGEGSIRIFIRKETAVPRVRFSVPNSSEIRMSAR